MFAKTDWRSQGCDLAMPSYKFDWFPLQVVQRLEGNEQKLSSYYQMKRPGMHVLAPDTAKSPLKYVHLHLRLLYIVFNPFTADPVKALHFAILI